MPEQFIPEVLDFEEREALADKAAHVNRRFKGEKLHSLCGTCRYAHILRRGDRNDVIVHCGQLGEQVPTNIMECNKYHNASQLTIMELAKLARIINDKGEHTGGYI
jgi:hypothetical protein